MPVHVQERRLPQDRVPEDLQHEADARWDAISALSASPLFARSPRLSQLLLFLARQTLAGHADSLTEQQIAWRVFDRDASFHPSSDTIVRSHLLRLRQRLMQHEAQPSAISEHFQITIPRGQYAVEFREREQPAFYPITPDDLAEKQVTLPVLDQDLAHLRGHTHHPAKPRYLWAILLSAFCAVCLLATLLLRRPPGTTPVHPLWGSMFAPGQTTTVVAADSSLVILHQFVRHDTSLADYLSGNYRNDARLELGDRAGIFSVANRRYTSMVDVSIVQHATELAAARHAGVESRFARELTLEDLKRSNAFLSGSRGANPWVELFEPQMNFVITNNYGRGRAVVKNRRPQTGEQNEYVEGDGNPGNPLFGVLAYLPNLDPSRNVLLIEGTSLAGTQAARDLLFDDHVLLPFLGKVRRADGSLRHFEMLLASTVVNGNSSKFQILTYRTYD